MPWGKNGNWQCFLGGGGGGGGGDRHFSAGGLNSYVLLVLVALGRGARPPHPLERRVLLVWKLTLSLTSND